MPEKTVCTQMGHICEAPSVSIPVVLKAGDDSWLCAQTMDCFSPARAPDVQTTGTPPGVRSLQVSNKSKSTTIRV